MGIHDSRLSSTQKAAESQLHKWEIEDFRDFMSRHYRGDFDDFPWSMIQAFRKWQEAGNARREPSNRTAKGSMFRTYVSVPFAGKDDFKRKFNGKWDPEKKLWWCVPATTDSNFSGLCNQMGVRPIAHMDGKKLIKIFDQTLFKKHFGSDLSSMMESSIKDLE